MGNTAGSGPERWAENMRVGWLHLRPRSYTARQRRRFHLCTPLHTFLGAASVMCFLQSRRNFDCTQYRRVMKAHLINLFMVTRRLAGQFPHRCRFLRLADQICDASSANPCIRMTFRRSALALTTDRMVPGGREPPEPPASRWGERACLSSRNCRAGGDAAVS